MHQAQRPLSHHVDADTLIWYLLGSDTRTPTVVDVTEWLDAPVDRSMEFMRQFPAEGLRAIPEPVPKAQMSLF